MPRSNRSRRRRAAEEPSELDLERIRLGMRRTEMKRSGTWNVQPVGAAAAQKVYTCPGCGAEVPVGVAHVVAWRADGLMGEQADLAARRHWHSRCWQIEP
ncbi:MULTISPECIES: hypothetical protein [Microcella]|uniref:hypothetical protein n=1 Tax=Microcella TaxID=337004 RepID=UPI0015CF5384|nr:MULTISPECIES: hypothetical protein [Microcella]MBU1251683.1 hypothetical protein [Actinomycetota bacterium]MBU1609146.1 hypothetical protein [Actinomycetota bacterium]MBU2316749.1 hypothetical protein [Actinomycetota bacterium]MBU2384381.1 hypothetical protein [Actinomycetota bacterium]QOD93107.1 hypothetical protein IE160_09200 [Chryseoglobus sp. 28M-23]